MNKELKVVGKPVTKIDAGIRSTGKAVYGHDVKLPNMLYGAILRAKYPCAEILSVDVSEAMNLPGVKCIITADDVNVNNISYKSDHPILKKGEVNCIRDEIAAVAATTREIAKKATRLIKVEYKVKEGVYDPFEAMEDSAPVINKYGKPNDKGKNIAESFHYEHGDLEEQKAKSEVIISRRYTLPRVTHCCMATSNITADFSQEDGRLTLYSSTQVPFLYQRDIAHALNMEPSMIRIIQPVIGGGFGSKLDMYPFEPICVLLSKAAGKPVQITFDREEEFIASPTRQNMVIDLKSGADKDGKFTFRETKIIMDNGAYTSWGATTPFVMMQSFSSLYQMPACVFDADAVYTNNISAGSFRGYGNPQATFAIERNIDLIAEELNMDKAEIRLLNANFKGEVTGQELEFKTCGHKEALETVLEKSNYHSPQPDNQSKRYKRGIGLGSMLHVGGGAKIYRSDGCGTILKIDDFGYLTITTGSTEIGQGSETVLAMIACEELGIELSKIKVINTDTDVKPWDVGVHASRTSFIAGNSLLGAIEKIKNILAPSACKVLNTDKDDLIYEGGVIKSAKTGESVKIDKVVRNMHFSEENELCIVSNFYEPESKFQDKYFKGNVSGNYAFASQAIEVEVDTYTGKVKVLNIHMSQDVGRVLNPLILKGQIDGGIAMGVGYGITEELKMDKGYVTNPSFHDYKLLTASDMPDVHFYPIETFDEAGPYGSKGVGEAPLIPTAAAIANAVSNAIGVEITSLPVNPEVVLRAINSRKSK